MSWTRAPCPDWWSECPPQREWGTTTRPTGTTLWRRLTSRWMPMQLRATRLRTLERPTSTPPHPRVCVCPALLAVGCSWGCASSRAALRAAVGDLAAIDRGPRQPSICLWRWLVANALALLDDRRQMNLEDWQLAGQIMIKSDLTRASVAAALQRKAREVETARAIGEGRRDVIRGRVVADDELQRACQAIIRKLGREGGWVPGKIVRKALTSKLRKCFNDAVDKLAETGQLEAENVQHNGQQGTRLRLNGRAR
jgi:hypothetical protein